MNNKTIILAIFAFYFSFSNSVVSFAQDTPDKNTLEVLFIGSSYFAYNNLPDLVENLSISLQKDIFIDSYIPLGWYLEDHVESNITNSKIKERKWDFVILQGVGSLTAYPDYYTHHPVYPALTNLKSIIKNNCPSTRIIFCMPWAFEDGMTWVGWPDTYEDMQIKIYDNTLQYANNIDLTIAPVGWAWYEILKEDNYPLHYLHMSDWNHPTIQGSYLMACVIFSTIYTESSENNSFYSTLSSVEAKRFQSTASNVVLNDLALWNITTFIDSTFTEESDTTNTLIEKVKTSDIILHQNYPNPFFNETTTNFELVYKSDIEFSVYNLNGLKIYSEMKKNLLPGKYKFKLNGDQLQNGTYLLCIKTSQSLQSILIQKVD